MLYKLRIIQLKVQKNYCQNIFIAGVDCKTDVFTFIFCSNSIIVKILVDINNLALNKLA